MFVVVRLKILLKRILWTFACVCGLLSLTVATLQVDQRLLRRKAERLLAQIDTLDLRKTGWDSAAGQFKLWADAAKYDPECNEHECTVEIALSDFVLAHVYASSWPTRTDDYLRYRFKRDNQSRPLSRALERLVYLSLFFGVRPAQIIGSVRVRNGIVWEKQFSVRIEVLSDPKSCTDGGRCEYTLIASSYTVPEFSTQVGRLFQDDLQIHSQYSIGHPSGCMGCVAVWAKFTPYADPLDVHRLMKVNLFCLTAWRPCRYESDVMPIAWAEHEADRRRLEALRNK